MIFGKPGQISVGASTHREIPLSSGYIYIIGNAAMPGLLKIRRTDRQPEQRARELRTTGVPHPFVLEHYVAVEDSSKSEAQVHRLFQKNGGRAI